MEQTKPPLPRVETKIEWKCYAQDCQAEYKAWPSEALEKSSDRDGPYYVFVCPEPLCQHRTWVRV